MSDELEHLLDRNREWAARLAQDDPEFFPRLAAQQQPEYLWIGCSDSRVSASQVIGVMPGEVFVHRNVANVVLQGDLNCLSVVEFAVRVLKVRHVIVCGHHGCGGVQAVLDGQPLGLLDNWLREIRDLREEHAAELDALAPEAAAERLCELNVRHQVSNVCHAAAVRDAWSEGRELTVHGWIYGLKDGLLRDLGARIDSVEDLRSLDVSGA